MKTWFKKTVSKPAKKIGTEIADDLMGQITGGQGKSACHVKIN